MSRRRTTKFLAVLACASLIAAACSSGDDGDEAITEGTSADSAATTEADLGAAETTVEGTEPESTESEGTETTESETDSSAPEGAENVGVEGGSGCGIPHGPYDDPGEATGEVRVAWNDPLLSFNNDSTRNGAVANDNLLWLMGRGAFGGFAYYDGDLNLINNDQFGTCTIESLDPLTVTYTINEGVTWSDGTPVDAADLLLFWGARSGVYNDGESVPAPDGTTAVADAEGNPVVLGPDGVAVPSADVELTEEGLLPEGYTYQESAGITFDAVDPSMSLVTQFPEISEDGRSLTITWDTFYVDYQVAGLQVGVPAHTTARLALGVEDPAEAKQRLVDALENNVTEDVKAISEQWNRGFDATSLPEDEGIYLSLGAYEMVSYDEVSEIVLEANPDYTWGPKPTVQTIVYRIIGDPIAAVQAIENEEIDIIYPQATADLLTQLQGLEDRGVVADVKDGGTYEHVDLAFANGGPFDPATYGGDAETALAVRQAFLKTIPRQEIVDRLIVPLNPEAALRGSFTTVPGAPAYDALVAENGSAEYAEVDIEGAQALLDEAGVTGPIDVRMLFAAENPRRETEYELIRDSALQVGFNVIDGRSPTWGQQLPDTSIYDASLFGWQTTSVAVADSEANFRTGGDNNYGAYSSEIVDGLYDQLKGSSDAEEQAELNLQIEQQLWADGFGVTIYQFPGVTAYNETYVNNVSAIPISPTVLWNFWEWEAA